MPARLPLLAFLVGCTVTAVAAQPVTLNVTVPDGLPAGATLGARGDTAPLAWDRSIPLEDADGDGVYTATLDFPTGTGRVGYKLVVDETGSDPTWESGDNRMLLPGRMDADRRAFGGPQASLPTLTVSQAQLARDLTVLQEGLLALHPGLFLHNSMDEMQAVSYRLMAQARALGAEYGEAIPMPEVYVAVSEAVAAIRDGHTQVSMYNQGAYTEAQLYRRADRVPFAFRLVGDRMIVTGDATPAGVIPPRTEILTLDGRPVADVLADMMPYASADGDNDAKRLDLLEVSGTTPPAERFDVFYSLLYGPEGDLDLTVRQPDGTEASLSVPRMTRDDRREVLYARDASLPRTTDDLLQYRLDDDGTAVITIGSFATFSMSVDYRTWLTDAFLDMNEKGAERLIVDLRGVAGGMDAAAALLLRHILQEPVEIPFWDTITAYDVVPETIRPHINSWSDDFYDLSSRVTPNDDGTFQLPSRTPFTMTPAEGAFDGPVAVLVDATGSSATFYLAQQIKDTDAALLVGQTTGGSLKGLNAGQMVFLTLPNTGIAVDVPLYGARPQEPGPDRGVIPDIVVPLDADAVVAGRDPEMEAALDALANGITAADDSQGEATVPAGDEPPVENLLDSLLGTWAVDLRPTPDADPYMQPFVVRSTGDGTFAGTFYRSPITNAVVNDDWGALRVAFITSDGQGPYHHTATLRGDRLEGVTHIIGMGSRSGQGLLYVWTATRQQALPLTSLAGDWEGSLTYLDYGDDATEVTLGLSASTEATADGRGVSLDLTYVEPDGSPGGTGSNEILYAAGSDHLLYQDEPWTILSRDIREDGFEVVFEREARDNNRPATIRHTIALADDELTDRKEVRYEGTDAFFERNIVRLSRQ